MGHPQQPIRAQADLTTRLQATNSGTYSGGWGPRRLLLGLVAVAAFVLYSMALVSTFMWTGCQKGGKASFQKPLQRCPRGSITEAVPPEGLVWEPRPEKYLLSICIYGRATNRVFCLMRSLVAAAFLNRTLIVPQTDLCPRVNPGDPFRLAVAADMDHLKACLNRPRGTHRVLTLNDYLTLTNVSTLVVDTSFIDKKRNDWTWWCQLPASISFKEHIKWDQVTTELTPNQTQTLIRTTSQARVLAMGDLFAFKVQGVPDSPKAIRSPCASVLQPPTRILRIASDFAEELTGSRYAALHLRRTDFQEHCRRQRNQCPQCKVPKCTYQPLSAVAGCVGSRMAATGLSSLFVASDAPEAHLGFLRSLLTLRGITMFQLVGTSLNRSSLEFAMVEKVVCARAEVFISQERSSFSDHISHLREGFNMASCWDGPLCTGEDVPAAT